MYMDFNFDMNNDFVFTTEPSGVLKGGGFVIQSELLKDTIGSSENTQQTGGSSSALLNTFKDLAVPAGLFFTHKETQRNQTIRYDHKNEAIVDDIYDKLVGMLEPGQRKLHARKTKKSKREIKKKHTRKQR